MLKEFTKGLKGHSSEVWTGAGVMGLFVTIGLVAKAALDTDDILTAYTIELDNTDDPKERKEIKKEGAKELVKACSGAAIATGFTCYSILKANKDANARQSAIVASVASAGQSALLNYKNKAKDILTPKQFDDVQVAEAEENLTNASHITHTGRGEDLCIESITGQPMYSDINYILETWNDLMDSFPDNGELSLGDWLAELGLNESILGEYNKWLYDTSRDLRTVHIVKRAIIFDGRPCMVIDYDRYPIDKEMR